MSLLENKNRGFTLVELLIVVALVTLIAGVTTDIILSLVRSYSKTKITNEIDQSANAALLKIEKELKTATDLLSPALGVSAPAIVFQREINNESIQVTYEVNTSTGTLTRIDDNDTDPIPVIDASYVAGAKITNTDVFTTIQEDPFVVQIRMVFEQSSGSGGVSFTGSIEINQTLVLRGTYQ